MRWVLLVAMCFTLVAEASGQYVPWTKSWGMAGADFAFSEGQYAVEWNPANLAFVDSASFSFATAVHNGRVQVDGVALGDLAEILTQSGSADPSIMDDVPAGGLRIDMNSEGVTANRIARELEMPEFSGAVIPTFGVAHSRFGLVLRGQAVAHAIISRELVDLAVNGFNPEQINEYAAKETGVRAFTFASLTAAYGWTLEDSFSFGLAFRYVRGQKLLTGRLFEPVVDVDNEAMFATATSIESRGGDGWGLDAGLTAPFMENFRFSVAFQNLWQRMTWSETLFAAQSTLDQDDLDGAALADLINRFKAAELETDATTLEAYATAQDLYTEAFFPRVFRVGFGWRSESAATEVQLTATKVMGRGELVPVGTDRLALGAQRSVGMFNLRTGIAFEENDRQQLGFGVGTVFGALELDLAGGYTRGTAPTGLVQGLSGSLGISFFFFEPVDPLPEAGR